jgi:hypothetical protein
MFEGGFVRIPFRSYQTYPGGSAVRHFREA